MSRALDTKIDKIPLQGQTAQFGECRSLESRDKSLKLFGNHERKQKNKGRPEKVSFLWKPRTVHKMNAQIGNEGICMAEVLVEQGRKIAKRVRTKSQHASRKVATWVVQTRNRGRANSQHECCKNAT